MNLSEKRKILKRYRELSETEIKVVSRNQKIKYVPKPCQRKLHDIKEGEVWVLKSRQVGLTTACLAEALLNALKGGSSCIITPSEALSKRLISEIRAMSPESFKYEEKTLIFPQGFIRFANSNYESLRGTNANYVYITEAGEIKNLKKLLDTIQPMTCTWETAKIVVDGTYPELENTFSDAFTSEMIQAAKDSPDNYFFDGKHMVVYNDNPNLKGRLTAETFQREVEMISTTPGFVSEACDKPLLDFDPTHYPAYISYGRQISALPSGLKEYPLGSLAGSYTFLRSWKSFHRDEQTRVVREPNYEQAPTLFAADYLFKIRITQGKLSGGDKEKAYMFALVQALADNQNAFSSYSDVTRLKCYSGKNSHYAVPPEELMPEFTPNPNQFLPAVDPDA